MLFAVHCLDKPGHAHIRQANRPDHLAYAKANADMLVLIGPMTTDDGTGMVGSFILIEAPDRAAVEAFCSGDPYAKAGLFESVIIRPFKAVMGRAADAAAGSAVA
ncbi:MAG: YciI family protein [Rhodospirillaceae bacterium]